MYLAPDGEEAEIANAAAAFLADSMPIGRLRTSDAADMGPALRRRLGEMGWFALAVPEAAGGSGLSAVEHALFFREAGRQCAPVDLLAQSLAANAIADEVLRQDVMAGGRGVALLVADGDDWRLLGHAEAELGLLVAPTETQLVALAGAQAMKRPALDPVNSLRVLAQQLEPLERRGQARIWQLGQLGTAAMLVGIAEAALDLITEYAKVRETFGRKIGAWQAVRHACADMAVRGEAARAQLWYAAAAIKEGRGDAAVHLAAAKHLANQTALANVDANIQLHGGIGITDEHDSHLLLKHALLLARLFGSKRVLLRQLLDARLED
jgi:alkylation response protein AidB-like acyl-CoA dehydrogenase